jgi:uncharacterized protein YdhG (YjbR/CyaY superfamily)
MMGFPASQDERNVMASSNARTVEEYLSELPAEKREVVSAVREVILRNLPEGYEETMSWGMISYEVPLERYPDTYNGKPLGYLALAAQKNHYAVYAHGIYMDPEGEAWVRTEFEKAGKKLDMGKSCIRFRKLEHVPLDVIGRIAGAQTVDRFLEGYERVARR